MHTEKHAASERRTTKLGGTALAACIAALLAFALSACSSPSPSSDGDAPSSSLALEAADASLDGRTSSEQASGKRESPEDAGDANEVDDGPEPDPELLASLMDEEEAAKLLEGARSSRERRWIATHPEALAMDGDMVQTKLLRLAADEDAAIAYVREFAEHYPADSADKTAAAVDSGSEREVPLLLQWDQRWGYTVYSSTAFGLTGCGPTAFAMAYQGVTGNRDLDPYDMGQLAQELGYMAEYEGTSASFLTDAPWRLGMYCEIVNPDVDSLRNALEQGRIIIDNVGHGYFSRFDGHYLVLTGINPQGRLMMNDPYSVNNSNKTWDIDFILGETKALYAYSPAEEHPA